MMRNTFKSRQQELVDMKMGPARLLPVAVSDTACCCRQDVNSCHWMLRPSIRSANHGHCHLIHFILNHTSLLLDVNMWCIPYVAFSHRPPLSFHTNFLQYIFDLTSCKFLPCVALPHPTPFYP